MKNVLNLNYDTDVTRVHDSFTLSGRGRFYLFFVAHPYETATERATTCVTVISVGIAFIDGIRRAILAKASLDTVARHDLDSAPIRRDTRCVRYSLYDAVASR